MGCGALPSSEARAAALVCALGVGKPHTICISSSSVICFSNPLPRYGQGGDISWMQDSLQILICLKVTLGASLSAGVLARV